MPAAWSPRRRTDRFDATVDGPCDWRRPVTVSWRPEKPQTRCSGAWGFLLLFGDSVRQAYSWRFSSGLAGPVDRSHPRAVFRADSTSGTDYFLGNSPGCVKSVRSAGRDFFASTATPSSCLGLQVGPVRRIHCARFFATCWNLSLRGSAQRMTAQSGRHARRGDYPARVIPQRRAGRIAAHD